MIFLGCRSGWFWLVLLATAVLAAATLFRLGMASAVAAGLFGTGLAGDFESHVLDHPIIFRGCLTLGGQIISDEDAVGDVEPERLQGTEVAFATSSDAKFALGIHKAEHGESSQAIAWGEVFLMLHGCSIDRMQEVEGDGFHVEFLEREGHFDDVALAFTHPDDPAAAELQTCLAHVLEGFHPIVEGMGGADLFVVFAARVQVVVDFVDPCRGQPHGLGFIEQTEARANIQSVLLLDFGNDRLDGLDFAFVRGAAADNDAVGLALAFRGDSGAVEEFVPTEDGVLRDRGVGDLRLAAVVAVLGAETAFCVH